ncbi:MAG: hypothetical protein ACRD3O_17405, partial [Terriglobia bacterium]
MLQLLLALIRGGMPFRSIAFSNLNHTPHLSVGPDSHQEAASTALKIAHSTRILLAFLEASETLAPHFLHASRVSPNDMS